MSEGTKRAYELWRDAAEKFDYFMAGLCTAVLGYLAPKFEAARFGCNPETLELLAMLFFVGAVFASLKRIESIVHLQRISVGRLEQLEEKAKVEAAIRGDIQLQDHDTSKAMPQATLQTHLEKRQELVQVSRRLEKSVGEWAVRWYSVRTYLLVSGFIALIGARVWLGYR